MAPKTQYAKKGDISIAYQVVGDGPIDLVLVNGLVAHMDLFWLEPEATAMLKALGSFSRLILFDKPGTGLSDPVVGAPTIEQRVEDIRAVMDAVDSERAALLGYSEGGPPSAVLAASEPDRVEALILLSSGPARMTPEPDRDFLPEIQSRWQECWRVLENAVQHWGEGTLVDHFAPSWAQSPVYRRTAPIAERACASPGMARSIVEGMRLYDVRSILTEVRVPTLVLHPSDEFIPVEIGRDLTSRIPGARFVELSGRDHIPFAGDWRPVVGEIEDFLTGRRAEPDPDRVLRTILFTDVVGSTELAAQIGDRRWRVLLEQHDRAIAEHLSRFGGRAIKNLGDGVLASFDGAARAVRCARAICANTDELGMQVRAGVHTGECEAIGDDLGGLAVHIGARVAALAGPSEVLVSGTVCDLVVGSGLEFSDRGTHELKGVPGRWRLYSVSADRPSDRRPVQSVDHEAAALTPGPRETMRPIDRAAVSLAKRAPAMGRLGFRLARPFRRKAPD